MFLRPFSTRFSALAPQTMASTTTAVTSSSPFTKVVVQAMQQLYPEKLADGSFDNTGLLLEAPQRPHLKNTVLLTVDLTKAVAEEAIARKDSIIIAYHPIIFRPLKALTLRNPQQSSLLRLAQEGISVYCPHTAVDAAPDGLNDWLANIVTACSDGGFDVKADHERRVITPVTGVPGFENAGYGRIVQFKKPRKLHTLLSLISDGLGSLPSLSVAVPQSVPQESRSDIPISSVGICAGSGGSMLNGLDVDMLFTGELSHHEALAAIEQGRVVVTALHSNTERLFLSQKMRHALWDAVKAIGAAPERMVEGQANPVHPSIAIAEVAISQADRDPFEIVKCV